MKLAWLTKATATAFAWQSAKPATPFASPLNKPYQPPTTVSLPEPAPLEAQATGLWQRLLAYTRQLLGKTTMPALPTTPIFLNAEQKQRQEQITTFAESPFEVSLFGLDARSGEYPISLAWAGAIKSGDTLTQEAALSLLKAFLAHQGLEMNTPLSPHTQMKLLKFAPHLTEGPYSKAILYEAVFSLPLTHAMAFADALHQEFAHLPPIAQALLLKQMMRRWKTRSTEEQSEETLTAFRKLIKSLVITFYTNKQEALEKLLSQHEKIRLGFLKFQPIEEAYQKQLEETERRYRLKLRQLKKRRAQKLAEVEEERLRRIEMIYDTMEGNLMAGLNSLSLEMEVV